MKSVYTLNGKSSFDWEIVKDGKVHGLFPKEFDDSGDMNKATNRKDALRHVRLMNRAHSKGLDVSLLDDVMAFSTRMVEDVIKKKVTKRRMDKLVIKMLKAFPKRKRE